MMTAIIAASRRRYRAAVLADSPVAYWRLGEASGTTAADEMATYAGTYVGSPTLGVDGVTKDGNKAVTFNGSSQYAKFGDVLDSVFAGSGKNFSIEAWVNITNNDAATRAFIAKNGDGTEDQRQFYFGQFSGKIRFAWFGTLASGSARVIESGSALSTGAWHHVAVTFTAANSTDTKAKLYVNGTETWSVIVNSGSPTEIQNGAAKISIGAALLSDDTTAKYFWGGSMDEVAIYPTALSAAQWLTHYNAR